MDKLKPYDAGDEDQVKEKRKKFKRKQKNDIAYWDDVVNTYAGRYVINCILEEMAKPFNMSFNPDNPRVTDFREGERNVGNQIIGRAFMDRSQLFNKMRDEHLQRQKGEVT